MPQAKQGAEEMASVQQRNRRRNYAIAAVYPPRHSHSIVLNQLDH